MTKEQYLNVVDFHLRDLPWRARRNLSADLRVHLNEIPAEDLEARLGSPSAYAAEMRAAAGLALRRGPIAYIRARRPRNVAIAVVVLASAGLFAGAIAWGRSYQPLSPSNYGMSPAGHVGPAGEFVATFRNGKPFQYGVSIRNMGRFAIRVLELPSQTSDRFHLRPFTMRLTVHGMEPPVPFRPFTLGPGQERLVMLRGTYATCRRRITGMDTGIGAFAVRERFLLWTHAVWVPLQSQIVVRNMGEHCH